MTLRLLPPAENSRLPRAAAYLRMSTDMQVHSLDHQLQAIEEFAAREGLAITQTYADPGRSGLTLKGRPALTSLLEDVNRGPDFEVLLVYDVSRWGRFQDADESAFYEFQCRRAGVRVEYCAEPFENDGSPLGAVFKSIKRTMAGEFSRELSVKISSAQRRLSARGFWQGAPAGYGLAREVISEEGASKGVLAPGEHKFLRQDRVRLAPGEPSEVEVVRCIFRLCCQGMNRADIARRLNAERVPTRSGGPWYPGAVRIILMNEKYAGHYVYCRKTQKLGSRARPTHRELWIRAAGVFEAVIPQEVFDRAQRILRARSGDMSNEELLDRLRRLLGAHAKLTAKIIAGDPETPSVATYANRFGGLLEAYALIGWSPDRDWSALARVNRAAGPRRAEHHRAVRAAAAAGEPPPAYATMSKRKLERKARAEARRLAPGVAALGS